MKFNDNDKWEKMTNKVAYNNRILIEFSLHAMSLGGAWCGMTCRTECVFEDAWWKIFAI
jgi:hypothetical protein